MTLINFTDTDGDRFWFPLHCFGGMSIEDDELTIVINGHKVLVQDSVEDILSQLEDASSR